MSAALDAGDPTRAPQRGEEIAVRVLRLDRKGRAHGLTVALAQPLAVELGRAVPGDLVRLRVDRRRRGRLEGQSLGLLERGPDSVDPPCAHAQSCGGCSFQGFAYRAQLVHLRGMVAAALAEQGLVDVAVDEVLPCEPPWHYRNKMEFSFGSRRWIEPGEPQGAAADFALGLHAPGRFDKVLDIERCHIVFEEANPILADARRLAREQGLAPWDARAHTGLLRHLVLRKGERTGEILVALITNADEDEAVERYARNLLELHPEITTLVHGVTTRAADSAIPERERVLHGPGFLRERILGLELCISAGSFFQTNTAQAERLFELVREEARGAQSVLDLFSGTGLIALVLAPVVGRVLGIELIPSAVADARRNAAANGITNVEFVEADVTDALRGRTPGLELPVADLAIVDPPRAGLHPKALEALLAAAPPRILYVSCNVHTAAAELARCVAAGYELVRARPVDLFPHTPHVECLFSLRRRQEAP